MARAPFVWSSEREIGTVEVNPREIRKVSLCSLDIEREGETEERWYIAFSTEKFFKKKGEEEETWRPVKGYSFPLDKWKEIEEMVNDHVDWGDEDED